MMNSLFRHMIRPHFPLHFYTSSCLYNKHTTLQLLVSSVLSCLLVFFWSSGSSVSSISAALQLFLLVSNFPSAFNIKHDPEPPEPPEIMASLEDIVASLTDRLRSLEIENQALQQGIRPESLREPKAALPDKFDGSRRHFRGFINQLELVFQLQDSDTIPTARKLRPSVPYSRIRLCLGTTRTSNSRNVCVRLILMVGLSKQG
ncbi:hypothetical protein BASA62_004952 [Batrachochytrium salamandrivorans]|nr:hypothetical protein BASA62_004952 [Batrachochytrium salamandrivorans]